MDMSNNLIYYVVFFDHVDYFVLSVGGETTIYSTAMGDVLLERNFNYLLYGISRVLIG